MESHRSDASENRARLLRAARRVFAERGLAAEIKEVAAAAGLGIGTLYRNFPHKDDLVLALLDEAKQARMAGLEEAENSGLDSIDKVRLVMVRSFESVQRYGWLLEALWTGQLPPQWRDSMPEEDTNSRFRALLESGISEGLLRPDFDIDMAVGMLAGPFLLYERLSLQSRTADEVAEALMRLFVSGAGSVEYRRRATEYPEG